MAELTELEKAVFDALAQFARGASVREIQDLLETPERGSRRLHKGEVRKPLEVLVYRGLAAKDKDPQTKAVTYRAHSDAPLADAEGEILS